MDDSKSIARAQTRVGEWYEFGIVRWEACARWIRGALKKGGITANECIQGMGMDLDQKDHIVAVNQALEYLLEIGIAAKSGNKYCDNTGIKRIRRDVIPKAIGTPLVIRKPIAPKPPKEARPKKTPQPRKRDLFSRDDIIRYIDMRRKGVKGSAAVQIMGAHPDTLNDYIKMYGLMDELKSAKREWLDANATYLTAEGIKRKSPKTLAKDRARKKRRRDERITNLGR